MNNKEEKEEELSGFWPRKRASKETKNTRN
jgi:hypothetical protein